MHISIFLSIYLDHYVLGGDFNLSSAGSKISTSLQPLQRIKSITLRLDEIFPSHEGCQKSENKEFTILLNREI